jgi:uncharacterized membrane protein YkgB
MTNYILNHLNWIAILVTGLAYWLLGALWFSLLFGKIWSSEVEKSGVKMERPSGGKMGMMFFTQFIYNVLATVGVAIVIVGMGVTTPAPAVKVGLVLGVLIAGVTQLQTLLWSGRSMKAMVIDLGYPVLGIILCSVILAVWHS